MDVFAALGTRSSSLIVMGQRPNTPPIPPDGPPDGPPPTGYSYVIDDAGNYVVANTGFSYRYVITTE